MTRAAVHFIRYRQNDVVRRNRRSPARGDQPHHGIWVFVMRVVIRGKRDPLRPPPIDGCSNTRCRRVARLKEHRLRRVADAGHVPSGQPCVPGQRHAEKRLRIAEKIPLANGRGIERAGWIGHRLIANLITGAVGYDPAVYYLLCLNCVVGGQDAENRIIAIHAVHAQIVPAEHLGSGRRQAERPQKRRQQNEGVFQGFFNHRPAFFPGRKLQVNERLRFYI